MTNEPEQQDLFDWKPQENKSLWFLKILKSKVVWLIVSFFVILFFIWLKFDTIKSFFAPDFYSKNSLLLIGTLSLILTFLSIWLIPRWQVKSLNVKKGNPDQSEFDLEKERIKLHDDTRKTMAQIIGGTFFVLGLFVTYNTFELNRQGQELSREGQVTERFSKAVELLGNEDLSVRIGGLYALERIAKDSPKDHSTIMEILAAYIRDKSKVKNKDFEKEKKEAEEALKAKSKPDTITIYKIRSITDLHAAATIINRRNIENDKEDFVFDLKEAYLSNIELNHANLQKANFSEAYLDEADFSGANLSSANFSGANLRNANLIEANLSKANLIRAELSGARLRNANLKEADFYDANLFGTNLMGVDLSNCKMTFEQLSEAILNEETIFPEELQSQKTELLQLSRKRFVSLFKIADRINPSEK